MKNDRSSTLGYIMNFMKIQTTIMAKELHVDPSLISKWKSGVRPFSEKTSCFEDVVGYIIEISRRNNYNALKSIMSELFPQEDFSDTEKAVQFLKIALSDKNTNYNPVIFNSNKTVSAMIFNRTQGRREAVSKLLDYAETMHEPGELTFADMEEFRWLWKDSTFSQNFAKRLISLLKKGFHATFVIHYSASSENFRNFFDSCSPIIFHKNANWYYMPYYDIPVMSFSAFLVNHAISALGISSGSVNTTMIFNDSQVVMQHEGFVKQLIEKSELLFEHFEPFDMPGVIESMPKFRKRELFFAFLPVPAFITADTELLKGILNTNNIADNSEIFQNIMYLNHMFQKLSGIHYADKMDDNYKTVLIFQIEKMIERIEKQDFVSNSLTLCCNKEIVIYPEQYAAELRSLAYILSTNPQIQIILASEKDTDSLPYINCWCMQNSYMLQMNSRGFRSCEESTIVSVASGALVRCMHKVPPERKNRSSVIKILLEMAERLECFPTKNLTA